MKIPRPFAGLLLAAMACAHPMGNLSVNHYARLEPGAKGVDVTYVLDLAELPTFELTQNWNVPRDAAKGVLSAKAAEQAREWVANLSFTEAGRRLTPRILGTELSVLDGAGNLPVFRIATRLHVEASGGRFEYADNNYPTRAGWREVVIAPGEGSDVSKASNGAADVSQALTSYPQDPTKAPPQDTRGWFDWQPVASPTSQVGKPVIEAKPAIAVQTAPAVQTAATNVPRGVRPPEASAMGTVKRDDAISRLLRMKDISFPLMLTLIGLAFWFGALHALEPGHGKTMVAAYLVGEKGTPAHAAILGGMVTFTHTFSVFILGLVTMFLSRYIMPDRISKVLGIVSGLSIVWIGGMLLWRRARKLRRERAHAHAHSHNLPHSHDHHHHAHDHHAHDHHAHSHAHPHTHDHGHAHTHDHDHRHDHDRHHEHAHAHGLTHTHDGHTHSHVPEGEISVGSLIALGASGGLVPCPSALILLLSAISIGRVGLGMVLLVSFSLGLAIVLTATGLAVLYAKNLLPEGNRRNNAFFRYMPVISAAAIVAVGVVVTSVSLGWIPAGRFIG
jgi:ABC-type nickel/cobalt efflux system permease component RcnA